MQEIWKSVNGILRPQKCSPNTLKIETMDKVIEEPLQTEKPSKKCTGFSYSGAKLFNILPGDIKKCSNQNKFKSMIKEWIWQEIPSY